MKCSMGQKRFKRFRNAKLLAKTVGRAVRFSAARALQLARHEDAVRVFRIAVEGAAVFEAEACVELAGGVEGFGRARLKTQPRVAAARGLGEDVSEQMRGDALS